MAIDLEHSTKADANQDNGNSSTTISRTAAADHVRSPVFGN
jgi:hypothetical protein